MGTEEFVRRAVEDLEEAIVEFGRYSLRDKGLNSVMDPTEWYERLRGLSAEHLSEVLVGILDAEDHPPLSLAADRRVMVEDLVVAMDERDDFDSILDADPRLAACY